MDTKTEEAAEVQIETGRFQIQVEDAREEKDAGQQYALTERLRTDKIDLALSETKKFLGKYSTVEPNSLSAQIIEGKIGEGTIKGTTIEIQMPPKEQSISEMKSMLGSILEKIPEEERDAKCEEIILALCASTILHEGAHGLINSQPDSDLAHDFEEITDIENINGDISTLLDEGIAYAVQAVYAPEIQPLGSLAPTAKESENENVRFRKKLGERLRPRIQEYLDQEKSADNEFLSFAASVIKNLELDTK